MPYGSGQRLGETIDPRFMQADYSGFTNAAAITGNALANIGQQIGGAIKQYGDDEKTIKKSAQMAKSIRDAIPELAGMADNALAELSNPDLSQRDRLAIAEGIQDSLKIGVMGLENKRSNAMMQLEAAKIQASMQGKARNIMTANELQQQIQSGAKVKYVPLGNGMYEVESATANETPLIGGVYTDENGQIRQAPSSGGNIRIPGSENISNALPEAQGGNFPDGISTAANTPMPEVGSYPNYGSIDQATQGVSADGSPGVLPPRQGAGQQIQAAQSLIPNVPVPKGDIFTVVDGGLGVGRPAGSAQELDYQLKQASLEKEKLESSKIKGETEKTSEQSTKAKNNFSTVIEEATNAYSNLYKKGGAVVGGEFSLGQVLASTNAGQKFGEITGSEAQLFRNYLDSLAPKILLGIMASTGLSATQLNSNAELQLQLKSLGDPSKPIQSNIAALDTLDKMYGDGTSVSKMLSKNPKLGALMKESGFDYGKKEASGDTELDSIMEEVKQIREKMGVQ